MVSTQFPPEKRCTTRMAKKTDEKAREIPVTFIGESEGRSESLDAESADAPDEEKRTVSRAQDAAGDANDPAGDAPPGTLTMEDDSEAEEPGAAPSKRM